MYDGIRTQQAEKLSDRAVTAIMVEFPGDRAVWRSVLTLFSVALKDFVRNNCHYVAAGVAYWTLFSLFPLALAAISIMSFMYTTPEEQAPLVVGIVKLIPVSEEYLADLVGEVVRARSTIGVLATIGLLWTGTAVFSAVRKGINHAWHIGLPQYFLLERAIDFIMLLGVAFLALMTVVITTDALGLASLARVPGGVTSALVGRVVLEVIGLALTFGAFLLLYRYVPNTKVAWRDTWLGALVGAVLFHGVRLGFAWFVASFSSFNLVYGSLGALMAMLVWAYLSSIAVMWGAQVAFTYSQVFGSQAGSLPELQPKAVQDTRGRGFSGTLIYVARWLLPPKRGQL